MNLGCKVLLLTGDDNLIDRKNILDEIKSEESVENGVILVSTQVIEAGVDIDMDIGYKDISKLDGDEQFMGRINRSCLRDGVVYFFNIDNAENIYRGDFRADKEYSLINRWVKNILISKNFAEYYKRILMGLKEDYNESTKESLNTERFFKEDVGELKFSEVAKKMKLIDDTMERQSVYLARKIPLENGEVLNGKDIWNQYV
ncbi:CRISPR-associated helicase/endonuclease Cas3, partial [Clostridium saudiense]|nr:CRISPR-associated helicase/endonuclease Cas3 [Clostridium saudiense]